jgi:hypothetical protein
MSKMHWRQSHSECNAYCKGDIHADVAYTRDPDNFEFMSEAMQRIFGCTLLDACPAPEAPDNTDTLVINDRGNLSFRDPRNTPVLLRFRVPAEVAAGAA